MRLLPITCALFVAVAATGCSTDEQDIGRAVTEAPTSSATTEATPDDPGEGTSATEQEAVGDGLPSAELESVFADVREVAPRLESFYRGGDYPRTLEEVLATLDDAGVALSPGNSLGAYRYDPDAVEFELCIEHEGGAYATYDTAPMSTRLSGETGGCPTL